MELDLWNMTGSLAVVAGWLVGWLAGWLCWLVGWLAYRKNGLRKKCVTYGTFMELFYYKKRKLFKILVCGTFMEVFVEHFCKSFWLDGWLAG